MCLCLLSCCFQTQAALKCTDADRLTTGTKRKELEGAKLVTREEDRMKGERNGGKPTVSRVLISSGVPLSSAFGPVLFWIDSIIVTGCQQQQTPPPNLSTLWKRSPSISTTKAESKDVKCQGRLSVRWLEIRCVKRVTAGGGEVK